MIPEFYEDKEIFITGGSGIVGTALIEMLLRSCNVRKIYILLRNKKDMNLEARLAKVKDEPIFRQLKLQKPNELEEKLAAVYGDATLPMLGITEQSAKFLKNVSIIYHCAATVRFDEPLTDALRLNVGGTLEVMKFAETLVKLKMFMHVSTFFSNPYLKKVEAKLYEAPMDWKLCLNLLERSDIGEEELDIITRKLIVGFPNTYTFTKNLAESLVNDYKDKLPVCIYRPSIVFSALESPESGFFPSLNGLMGLFAVTGAGLLKTIYIDKNNRLDISPQDVAVKSMLYYTRKAAEQYEKLKPREIPVYITSSYNMNNATLMQHLNIVDKFGLWEKAAFEKSLFLPGIFDTSNRLVYMVLFVILHLLPALFVDSILMLLGRQPAVMRIQRKLFKTLEVMKPFMFNNYDSDGVTDLEDINKQCKDLEVLLTINDSYNEARFFNNTIFCIRHLLLKEDPQTLPMTRKIFKIKVWLRKISKFYILHKIYLNIMEYTSSAFITLLQK